MKDPKIGDEVQVWEKDSVKYIGWGKIVELFEVVSDGTILPMASVKGCLYVGREYDFFPAGEAIKADKRIREDLEKIK